MRNTKSYMYCLNKEENLMDCIKTALCIIVIFIFATGCTNNSQTNISQDVTDGDVHVSSTSAAVAMSLSPTLESTEIDKATKEKIAQDLLNKFNENYDNYQKSSNDGYTDPSSVNVSNYIYLIESTDAAIGLLGVYSDSISVSDLNSVKNKYVGTDSLCPVSSYYTSSGVHIVVIAPMLSTPSMLAEDAANVVRNDNQERDLSWDAQCARLGLYDVYVEDLTDRQDEIAIDFQVYNAVTTNDLTDDLKAVLDKYGRGLNQSDVVKSKTWNLYAASLMVGLLEPQGIKKIVINGEEVLNNEPSVNTPTTAPTE